MRLILLFFVLLNIQFLLGQESIDEPLDFVHEVLRPAFEDSTLLFYCDSTIWYCHHKSIPKNNGYYEIGKSWFHKVDTCKGYVEYYQSSKGKGSKNEIESIYLKHGKKVLYEKLKAELIITDNSTMVYREYNSENLVTKSSIYKFNLDSIVWNHTISVVDPILKTSKTTKYKYFKVEEK